MAISLESMPRIAPAAALATAALDFGIEGRLSVLPSERDQNFLILAANGGKFVLKIANASDTADVLDLQNQAMRCVAQLLPDLRVQQPLPTRAGEHSASIRDPATGNLHRVRLLTWIDGQTLAAAGPRAPPLFESIGAWLGRLDAALCYFSHPAMHRVLQWDVYRAGVVRQHVGLLTPEQRRMVEVALAQWEKIDWPALRKGVIHGDANDHNVIVESGRMVGILDFGDMVYTAVVGELAVALAYAMQGEAEPLACAAHLIRAYHRQHPLSSAEQQALYPLIRARLSMSVCYAAHNRARNPHDPYQVVSESAAWELLYALERWPADAAAAVIRAACDGDGGRLG
jgi:Ser/Thr protein kinase RdoA (MazF antagonist)